MALNLMSKQEFLDLCGAYALGALDANELALFLRTAARADAEMKAALSEALKLAAELSLAAPEAEPAPEVRDRLRDRLHARVQAEAPAPRPARREREPLLGRILGAWMRPRPALALAFSMLVATVGLIAYSSSLKGRLEGKDLALLDTHERMRDLADSTRARITALEDSLGRSQALLEVIRARGMQVVMMGGMEDSTGYGKILWDPERKTAVLQVSLPPEPEGMDYQLWIIRDKQPMDAGVFQVAARGGDGFYRIDRLVETDRKRINAFAVTMEPKGGMPQPTGKMYLMGSIEL